MSSSDLDLLRDGPLSLRRYDREGGLRHLGVCIDRNGARIGTTAESRARGADVAWNHSASSRSDKRVEAVTSSVETGGSHVT